MFVANGATKGQSHPDCGSCFDSVNCIANQIFCGNRSTFASRYIAAIKARGNALIQRRHWQQITRELLDGELVKWHVVTKGVDDPIPIGPDAANIVEMQTMGISVASSVEPKAGHMFAVVR